MTSKPPTSESMSASMCQDCGTMLIRMCPCCELGADTTGNERSRSDTLSHLEGLLDAGERNKRPSSEPPPIPTSTRKPKLTPFAQKLLALNNERLGPSDALDLTHAVIDDNEELAQDEIDALFGQ